MMAVTAANRNTDSVLVAEEQEARANWAVVTAAASGENTIIAAPGAGKRLVVCAVKIQRNISNTAETLGYWQWGAGAEVAHFWFTKTNDTTPGEIVFFPMGNRWIGPINTALLLDLSAANSHLVSVQYLTETL